MASRAKLLRGAVGFREVARWTVKDVKGSRFTNAPRGTVTYTLTVWGDVRARGPGGPKMVVKGRTLRRKRGR